ncbi:MAG: hypothetical protein A4E30_00304 [Methanomassiliicoccales archaeon PtaB.Bin215]|nr:MAG: hypothetical protein A4E30_00304 [Methanomassiliicoccales archaeon PtaB.Bin215]
MTYSFHIKSPGRSCWSRANWWGSIANGTQRELEKRPYEVIPGPVKIDAEFLLPRPMRSKAEAHLTKPDIYLLTDALKGLGDGKLHNEATQVVELNVRKKYGSEYSLGLDVEVDG